MDRLSNFAMLAICLVFVGACAPKTPQPIGKEAIFNKVDGAGHCDSGYGFDSDTNLCMPKEEVCGEHEYNCGEITDCGDGFEFDSGLGYCVPIVEYHDGSGGTP